MGIGDPQQVFGVQELYRPPHEPIEIDIVAVHGLNGDAIKSWSSENICWLSHPDFLPKYVKRARVLAWGYNANISPLTGNSTSSERLLQHAQTLIAQLQADRDALAYSASRQASKIVHLHSIYTCTFAILFFGTPHHGSNKALTRSTHWPREFGRPGAGRRLLGSLQKLASLAIPKFVVQTESSLVNALKEDCETLQNITDQFAPLMANFRIFFLWEQERTNLKYTKKYIVDARSAAPILDNTERCGIAADHNGMCKFDKGSAQGFRTVVAALRRYGHDAPPVIRSRWIKTTAMLAENQRHEAIRILKDTQGWPADAFPQETVHTIEDPSPQDNSGPSHLSRGATEGENHGSDMIPFQIEMPPSLTEEPQVLAKNVSTKIMNGAKV